MKEAVLIVYSSANGRDGWYPLKREDVPEWVKHPDIMGHLVAGEMCMDVAGGPKGSCWFRAEQVETQH